MKKKYAILVVTNDSTVFSKKGIVEAMNIFGGRLTEVRNLYLELLEKSKGHPRETVVSFGIISTKYGFVPGNYCIMEYGDVMSCREDYERVEREKQYLEMLKGASTFYEKVVVCVPKDMFSMMLESEVFGDGTVIAVTHPDFKGECERRGWTHMARSGARVGRSNAEEIVKMLFP